MALYALMDRKLQPALKAAVDLYHCPSRFIQTKAEALGYQPTAYVPLGIDHQLMDCEPAQHKGPPIILYVGALCEEKGLLFVPEAFRLIRQRVPDATLVLCGRGSLERRLKDEFKTLGLEASVEFSGFVDHDKIVDYYRRAHVFILPSIWAEQFGLVGPEALACGVPCVGTNVGGIPEWLKDDEWGFLVPPRDSAGLAERVVHLLTEREKRISFGLAGREYVRRVHNPGGYQRWLIRMAELYASARTRKEVVAGIRPAR